MTTTTGWVVAAVTIRPDGIRVVRLVGDELVGLDASEEGF